MFERYTEPAKHAVFRARLEAGCRSGENISTVHLLLGLVLEEKPRANIAIPLKRHADAICVHLGLPRLPKGKFPGDWRREMPLDGNARLALAYAAQEADLDKQAKVDTDHLVRGLLNFPNETSNALESLPLDLASAREASRSFRARNSTPRGRFFRILRLITETLVPPLALLGLLALAGAVLVLLVRWRN
jgi:ATP-dependent Clp protease ATP-binding subunit ClpA